MDAKQPFAGYRRRRKTRRSVRLGEVLSRFFITVGGIGTILAVAMVGIFLVWVAAPLFGGASVKEVEQFAIKMPAAGVMRTGVDEYQHLGWTVLSNGTFQVFRLDTGQVLEKRDLFPGLALTACSAPTRDLDIAFGFSDGTVRLGKIGFSTRYLDLNEVPSSLRELPAGQLGEFDSGLVTRTPEGQFRAEKIQVDFEEPIKPTEPGAVQLIDLSIRPDGPVISLLTVNGKLRTSSVSNRPNFLNGQTVKELTGGEMSVPARAGKGLPDYLLLSGVGDNVYLIWTDGHLLRISTQDLENPKVVEEVELLGDGSKLTAVQFQIGKSTLLAGDSSGRIRAWFRAKPEGAQTGDGAVLVAGHELPSPGVGVISLATSTLSRLMAAGYADGRVRLYYVTSEKFLAEIWTEHDQPVRGLILAPKEDGLLAQTSSGIWRWDIDPGYPEVTLRSLFRPVWYEGYEKPTHVWQSSSGSDEFEPKFGLWPLVFGTLKATFYSLLLGVPLALLAAVYTSEFLHPRTRAVVKPTIELMASLPSVVLGFLAALVLAPFVEKVLPAVLAGLVTVPVAFLLGAYFWQLVPEKWSLRLLSKRFAFIFAFLPIGVVAAIAIGPMLESLLFHEDLKGWLAGEKGSSISGWMLLLIPLCALAMATVQGQVINPWLRRFSPMWKRSTSAAVDLSKFLGAALLTVAAAWALGAGLNVLGLDPRESFMGTYVQRNALVVGFMMGFAIIPIIFTIAEDALSSVPEHLRSASLGCGATRWQTARRIIIPTAMSGLFSAVMIGLGRAVGETMIVLMAAGNTPVMEMNIFNGFRTLSANIAVELPEAVRDSTHYRTLFLAALTLFAMTFAVNTAAEAIRLRFRKRAFQL
ncbi:MAG TPA: ABC transporter permease subunit [Gemmataceae bacterium]|nr:ABC transporter permease subunit [Gemmataceae bacterium]